MNSIFAGQFNYYPPISLNHSCINNKRVIYLNKDVFNWYAVILFVWRCFQLIYSDSLRMKMTSTDIQWFSSYEDVFIWYTVILFVWRTTGRRMGHFPFTIKICIWNIKDKISILLRFSLTFFIWREIITTFNKKNDFISPSV